MMNIILICKYGNFEKKSNYSMSENGHNLYKNVIFNVLMLSTCCSFSNVLCWLKVIDYC